MNVLHSKHNDPENPTVDMIRAGYRAGMGGKIQFDPSLIDRVVRRGKARAKKEGICPLGNRKQRRGFAAVLRQR